MRSQMNHIGVRDEQHILRIGSGISVDPVPVDLEGVLPSDIEFWPDKSVMICRLLPFGDLAGFKVNKIKNCCKEKCPA